MNIYYQQLKVKTWYLYFNGLIPGNDIKYSLQRWEKPGVNEYLNIYKKVGEPYGWTGRLILTHELLMGKLHCSTNEVWLFKQNEHLLGFFEIDRSVKGKAEIVYLGLLPEMIGKGHGKSLIKNAVTVASGSNGDEVWLHTCEFDHPCALKQYLAAGFSIEKETIENEYYSVEFIKKNRKL